MCIVYTTKMTMNDRGNKTQMLVLNSNLSDSEIDDDNSLVGVHEDEPASVKPNLGSSDDECAPVSRVKKKLQRFADSDSDADTDVLQNKLSGENETKNIMSTSEHSDSKDDSESEDKQSSKNEEQQLRMKNKRNKLSQRFKSLVKSRSKETSKVLTDSDIEQNQSNFDASMDEESFLNNEQEINKNMPFKSSICDPDTSDDENLDDEKEKLVSKLHQRKSTKTVSPKPLRMTAKQAMENMQKIRSESNRLLREKEISLPYHRPKAFSLKDIMSRRKPAISVDGKALPIKMNEEQLKQYVQMLEQRQKDIMDLCKSESDEEQDDCDAVKNQKEPLETKENDIASASLENNEDISTKVLVAESTSVNEIPSKGETEVTNTDDVCVNTELHNSTKTKDDTQCSLEDNLLAINNNLNKENVETDINNISKKYVSEENVTQHPNVTDKVANEEIAKISSDPGSQIINLHYDSENTCNDKLVIDRNNSETLKNDDFELQDSSDEIDMDYIDQLIENAEISKDKACEETAKSSTVSTTAVPLHIKPKLTGAPGMVIDLDRNETVTCKKMSGLELLKERFSYFAKLKTPEELERENEKKLKPGVQHLKLKQELEDIIAEQRSLEWAKRLNEEKQQQMELKALRGEESDAEDDIEKIEALMDEKDVAHEETSEEGESEPEEEELGEIKEKPTKKHSMIDDEAEESDCDAENIQEKQTAISEEENDANDIVDEEDYLSGEESSDESSDDELENEKATKVKKGRILKAFEDSDDDTSDETRKKTDNVEDKLNKVGHSHVKDKVIDDQGANDITNNDDNMEPECEVGSQMHTQSQDDEIQLAQRMQSASDDMFGSQESASVVPRTNSQGDDEENAIGTQTFSILKSTNDNDVLCNLENSQKLSFTQALHNNLDAAAALCSVKFTQNLIPSNLTSSQQPIDQSQPIGEDVLALCTGNFYDNQFISQTSEKENEVQEAVNDNFDDSWCKADSQENETDILIDSSNKLKDNELKDNCNIRDNSESIDCHQPKVKSQQKAEDQNLLQSILDELNDDDKIDSLKPSKYFVSKDTNNDVNDKFKKKFVIESDDEMNADVTEQKRKKKVKKKKLEQRALQISDDEEEESYDEEDDIEQENDAQRIVEYDSEENEVEVRQQNPKKRKANDFFENEAELTSEDEWVGSGDEDEAGLDRMEREEGDDDTFHQGKLQRELGQIHMRDVLDQDKREVRLIQELLFEDGDLGGGSRQRKFRWRNADGEEGPDAIVDDFMDTQEEEFESEEQWRKQRHERETFLRQMEEQEKNQDSPNVTISRTSIIKANLTSKSMSSLLLEVNDTTIKKSDKIENSIIKENTIKDVPHPRNGFTILQQNYHSSLLTRGRGALARLAALATPLAVDEDSTKVATVAPKNQRNFVFAAITKEDNEPKVTKRKADSKLDTPRLVKKLRTNEKQTLTRNSLLDHLKI